MIQDISPLVYDNHYEDKSPDANSRIVFMADGTILLKEKNGNAEFPLFRDGIVPSLKTIYLFSVSGESFFLAESEAPVEYTEAEDHHFVRLSSFSLLKPKWLSFAAITAYQIGSWYRNNRFCGRCGGETHRDSRERMLFCEKCHIASYPKICPAVIVAVTDGDKLLMTKYAGSSGSSHHALIAGFCEVGETVEETVHREVMEEVGVKVKNLRYYKSQPWSFSDTLLFGFVCELDGSGDISMDSTELSVAEWVKRSEITEELDGVSLTNEMIIKFKNSEL